MIALAFFFMLAVAVAYLVFCAITVFAYPEEWVLVERVPWPAGDDDK